MKRDMRYSKLGYWGTTGAAIGLALAGMLWPSPEVTRVAMLLIGAATLLAVFALGSEICGSIPGTPALMGVALFGLSPLFYTQSMLAQLDLRRGMTDQALQDAAHRAQRVEGIEGSLVGDEPLLLARPDHPLAG